MDCGLAGKCQKAMPTDVVSYTRSVDKLDQWWGLSKGTDTIPHRHEGGKAEGIISAMLNSPLQVAC